MKRPRLNLRGGVALALGLAWAALAITHGGLRTSWRAVLRPAPVVETSPSHLASGPYFTALDALAPPLGREDTVAAVLAKRDLFGPAPAVRLYETIYRLYPVRPDFYFHSPGGRYRQFWFEGRPGETPRGTELWDHGFVLWADRKPAHLPESAQPMLSNSAATLYRTGGGRT